MTLLRSQHSNLLWKISTRALRKNFSYPAAVTIPHHHRALSTSSDQEPTLSPKPGKNSPLNPFLQSVANYANLSKFRLSALVVVTTSAGYLCTGVPIDPLLLSTTCIGTALCAASANSFNQTIERDYDRLMNRTKQRPLPSGKLTVPQALTFAISSGAAGVGMLYAFSNPVVALLGAGNIFLYAGPYTHMKRLTEANTWVGSVVGAIPPAMGWAAATGGDLMSLDNGALCALLFLWQFPHFFALAWMHREVCIALLSLLSFPHSSPPLPSPPLPVGLPQGWVPNGSCQ
jgi:heme O synthase-like polyprenyltransferase